jgi:hypothetical protein
VSIQILKFFVAQDIVIYLSFIVKANFFESSNEWKFNHFDYWHIPFCTLFIYQPGENKTPFGLLDLTSCLLRRDYKEGVHG